MDIKLEEMKKVKIKDEGLDEYWLQSKIYEKPEILGLGNNVIAVHKEKKQSSGGRIDILLENPDDNNSLFEVEVMLGETDPSHIIRTIEYWDLERKRYPQRQHYAVLIAEQITRRFYNVIQLLSTSFPLIAIKVQLLKNQNFYALDFVKVLDIYQEQGFDVNEEAVDDKHWQKKANWVLDIASIYYNELNKKCKNIKINYTISYISIMKNNTNIICIRQRANKNVRMEMYCRNSNNDIIEKFFDDNNIPFQYNTANNNFIYNFDMDFFKKNQSVFVDAFCKITEQNINENYIEQEEKENLD